MKYLFKKTFASILFLGFSNLCFAQGFDRWACMYQDIDHDCLESCRYIYGETGLAWVNCEKLNIRTISRIKRIHDSLEIPVDYMILSEIIKSGDLNTYISISDRPFRDIIESYSSIDAKDVLSWISLNPKIFNAIHTANPSGKIIQELLDRY